MSGWRQAKSGPGKGLSPSWPFQGRGCLPIQPPFGSGSWIPERGPASRDGRVSLHTDEAGPLARLRPFPGLVSPTRLPTELCSGPPRPQGLRALQTAGPSLVPGASLRNCTQLPVTDTGNGCGLNETSGYFFQVREGPGAAAVAWDWRDDSVVVRNPGSFGPSAPLCLSFGFRHSCPPGVRGCDNSSHHFPAPDRKREGGEWEQRVQGAV